MQQGNFLIRRKVVKIKPTPIPDSLYTPETFVQAAPPPRIVAPKRFEDLARPRAAPAEDMSIAPLPRYMNPPPSFSPVDFRVNAATVQRDAYLLKMRNEQDRAARDESPDQFLAWQEKMKGLDEQQRQEEVQRRHQDLDESRRNAHRARKRRIKERLAEGNKMREQFGKEYQELQQQIVEEREKIHQLKGILQGRAELAVSKMKKKKLEETKEMKKKIRGELREAKKMREAEVKAIKEKANQLRDDESVLIRKGDTFIGKKEITNSNFLAALSDEETDLLLSQHAENKKKMIQELIEKHRRMKEEKMEKLYQMLEESQRKRDMNEEEFLRKRKEKQEALEREQKLKEEEEEKRVLELEARLEKKRKERIKEAEIMEEHTRQIAARNRYLALNKKAITAKVFQSQQDAKLRTAKERQTMDLPIKQQQQAMSIKQRQSAADLVNLKGLLGI